MKLERAEEWSNMRDTVNGSQIQVAPGRINWHKEFSAARAAARKSGKPILLFQMLGNLDERFC